jgi:predicted DsbA family dithiol-disulfide isomerase
MSVLKIDFYSDITCPWCIIGQHRLDKVLAECFQNIDVDIEHHPIELLPDCPSEGVRIADFMMSRHGVTNPSVLWARPHAEARASGMDLDLSRQPFAYPTIGAHTLIRLARERGTQHALAGAILSSYFHKARNISNHDTLADIASEHGFKREEVMARLQSPNERSITARQIAQSRARGVSTVPHFNIGGISIIGAQREQEIASTIEEAIRHGQRVNSAHLMTL